MVLSNGLAYLCEENASNRYRFSVQNINVALVNIVIRNS